MDVDLEKLAKTAGIGKDILEKFMKKLEKRYGNSSLESVNMTNDEVKEYNDLLKDPFSDLTLARILLKNVYRNYIYMARKGMV